MIIQVIAIALAVILTIVLIGMVIAEVIDIVHRPEYKHLSSYVLIGIWGLITSCCIAAATYFSMEVATKHFWLWGIGEVIMAYAAAVFCGYKILKSIDFRITGIDYDAIMGKSHRRT